MTSGGPFRPKTFYDSMIIADGHSKKPEFWEKHKVDILKAKLQREGGRLFCLFKKRKSNLF